MPEYIDREALEVALNHRLNFLMAENGEYDHYTSGFEEAVTRVECFPSADVAPVRHGRLVNANGRAKTYQRICTVCGGIAYFCGVGCSYKFCPNCGARTRMDGGYKNDE